ncbi:hypothetical protein A0H81_01359 [Grifola frondosa]|uniref:50S ribosomal protein L10 n=1 Tax=Grifola frondosa TaxID=5627 RepID=A0A1C7MPR5_GRIFR|nr:hypothetical protein A0H81_01359 [Grifola frondosa]
MSSRALQRVSHVSETTTDSLLTPCASAHTHICRLCEPPVIYPNKTGERVFSERKTYLFNQYNRILQSSTSCPLLLFQYADFSTTRLIQLRSDIATAALRHVSKPSLASPSPQGPHSPSPPCPSSPSSAPPFLASCSATTPLDTEAAREIAKTVSGGLAVLSFPDLNPPQLNAILRALARAVPSCAPQPQDIEQAKKDARRLRTRATPEATAATPIPDLKLLAEGVQSVAELPTLETLRAQIVGLLSSPATQLAMVLSEASGGKLARTLEGFKKSLEEGQGGDAQSGSS